MGLWFRSPVLQKSERLLWSVAANHDQADRAIGGKLFVTSRRLVFTANRIEARMRGIDWEAPLETFRDCGVADRDLKKTLAGGMRRRLRLVLADGSEELFVVKDAEEAAKEIRRHGENRGDK